MLDTRRKETLKPEQHLEEDNIAGSLWPVSVHWMCWLDNPYCAETNSTMCCARFKCLVKPRGFSIWKWLWYERSTQKHESQVKGSVLKRCTLPQRTVLTWLSATYWRVFESVSWLTAVSEYWIQLQYHTHLIVWRTRQVIVVFLFVPSWGFLFSTGGWPQLSPNSIRTLTHFVKYFVTESILSQFWGWI